MDGLTVTDAQLQSWLQTLIWPMVRIGGLMMAAPVIGDRATPARVRLMLILALTLLLVPALPAPPVIAPFTADWWLRTAEELLLGVLLGFVLKLIFEAAVLAGELVGNSMGLGFARMADPVRGVSVPVVGQFYNTLFVLLFLSFGGHLRLIELLAGSLRLAPDPARVLLPQALYEVVGLLSQTFAGGLSLALPAVAALLLVNLAFGVMSRAAPALNATSVGFPLSLTAGMILIWLSAPTIDDVFERLWLSATSLITLLLE